MGFSKASLWAGWTVLGTICLAGCGPDPRSRFIADVEGMIQRANEGRHGDLDHHLSGALMEKIRGEGWEPRAVLVWVARRDREDGATYRLEDVPCLERHAYAEADILRTGRNGVTRLTVPFLWENGAWKAGASRRDGQPWDHGELQFEQR